MAYEITGFGLGRVERLAEIFLRLREEHGILLGDHFVEPLLYLLAFGVGVGSLIGTLQAGGVRLSYRSFIFSGIIGQTVLFQGFYEGSFGAFVRMYYQRIFQTIAITPITLSEVLVGRADLGRQQGDAGRRSRCADRRVYRRFPALITAHAFADLFLEFAAFLRNGTGCGSLLAQHR